MRTPTVFSMLIVLSIGLSGCRKAPDNVLATWDGGSVVAAEVDRALLSLPAHQRDGIAGSTDELTTFVREIAVWKILLAEARERGLDGDPEFTRLREDRLRDAAVALYLDHHPLAPDPPTDEQIEAYSADHPELRHTPARRLVYTLYKRFSPDVPHEQTVAEVESLRRRVIEGEPFPAVAAANSDSELRHSEGLLGFVTRNELAPDLDRLIFSLDEGVPSRVVTTADGAHLFFVRIASPAREFTVNELRPQIVAALRTRAIGNRALELAEEWGLAQDVESLDDAAFTEAVAGVDPGTVIFRVGDFEFRVSDLQRHLIRTIGQNPQHWTPDLPRQLTARLLFREVVYLRISREGLLNEPDAAASLRRELDGELVTRRLAERVDTLVDEQPERLRRFFDDNANRYESPLLLDVSLLVIPIGADASRVMAELERASASTGEDAPSFEALAAAHGGRVENIGWVSLRHLDRIAPRAVAQAGQLTKGSRTPPFRTENALEVIECGGRIEPSPAHFEDELPRIRADYLRDHSAELMAEVGETIVDNWDVRLIREHIDALRAGGFRFPEDA